MIKNKCCSLIFLFLTALVYGNNETNLVNFGYRGEYWQSVVIEVNITIKGKSIYFVHKIADKDLSFEYTRKGKVDYAAYQKFLSFIADNNIMSLKTASMFDNNTKEEDLDALYKDKMIDHQSSFIYSFYFCYFDKKVEFKVDDVKNISDKRYAFLLEEINKILKVESYKTIFEFSDYLNKNWKRKEDGQIVPR